MDFFKFLSKKKTPQKRTYNAAKFNNAMSGFVKEVTSVDSVLKDGQLDTIRERARTLCENDDFAKRYLQLLECNVIGSQGIKLHLDIKDDNGNKDEQAIRIITDHWNKFCKAPTPAADITMTGLQGLLVRTLARDGEALFQKIYNLEDSRKFLLHPLECDLIDSRVHNLERNQFLGIEKDAYGRVTKYHIRKNHPGDKIAIAEPKKATDFIHVYKQDRPNQTRGVSWLVSAIPGLHHLRRYYESEAIRARIASCMMLFFEKDADLDYKGDNQDDEGNTIIPMAPGVSEVLDKGMKPVPVDFDSPNSSFGDFSSVNLKSIASGLGVSVNALTCDYEKTSYTSLRAASLEDRSFYESCQKIVVDRFLSQVFTDWLDHNLSSGAITTLSGKPLPMSKFDKFNKPIWKPQRWSWVDPVKDVSAKVLEINNLLDSRTNVSAQLGRDLDEIFDELQSEKSKMDSKDLIVNPDSYAPNLENQKE